MTVESSSEKKENHLAFPSSRKATASLVLRLLLLLFKWHNFYFCDTIRNMKVIVGFYSLPSLLVFLFLQGVKTIYFSTTTGKLFNLILARNGEEKVWKSLEKESCRSVVKH